jgi:glycosyltransferase involved in cell wall biosynthesis
MNPAERADLRMPDLALLTLIRRAPPEPQPADARSIIMVYTSLGPGGAERQLANTVHGLSAVGTEHDLVLMPAKDKDPVIDRFHATGLATLPIRIDPCAGGPIDEARLHCALGPDAFDLLALLPRGLSEQVGVLTSRFLQCRPEVVHAWGDHRSITAGVAATLAGVPRIVLSGRTIATPGSRAVPGYFRTVYRALLNRRGTVLLNNSGVGAVSYAEWLGVDSGRIRVIYNGIHVEALEGARDAQVTAAHRARLGLPADARVVGTAFRLGGVKRPLLWVRAAAEVARRVPQAHFVIVGDGPLRAETQSLARKLGIAERLHMPGLTRHVVPWFELMDVVLLTSEREGTSNTALEAQALGIPVVSTAVGGMPETFAPGVSGFLVDADPSPEAIAERVVQALTDQDWRKQARPAAQAFIRERFSLERMIRDTLQVYDLPASEQADEPRPDGAESVTGQVA